ncbi:TetR/AcrR family transcriptional regulator [Vallitalea sp.]|jgi:AcrR family transcriptional regulator|uniref:TetR/AcrR family transcriptional regulator n=1 Tax=Vallitalea sp. TaxID=1882829 RepID=UPI0025DBFE48|nr:TetR/AcrR family transcriptional regulator [Vallitalea sp.]MCT4687236.1 TetR/AcrR family transcriptional regulator [Vallitalea sp.]
MNTTLHTNGITGRTRYHKSTFDKISEERKKRIIAVATSEFATNGYNASNINTIAKKAEISIGSMYSYFASKEDLFLTIVDECFGVLESVLYSIDTEEGDIFYTLEKLLRASRHYAIKYPEFNQIYLDVTTQALSKFSSRLSHKLEDITANFYMDILESAQESNLIDKNMNYNVASFCIDNLIIMFQFSYTSDYYRERMKIFTGYDTIDNEEMVINEILKFMKKALI